MKLNVFGRIKGLNDQPMKDQTGKEVLLGDVLLDALLLEEQTDSNQQVTKFKLAQRVFKAMDSKLNPKDSTIDLASLPEKADTEITSEEATLLKSLVSRKNGHPIVVARCVEYLDGN